MEYTDDAIRIRLHEAALRLLKDPDCPFSEEEMLAKYMEMANDENIQWIRELLLFLAKAQRENPEEI